DLAAEALSNLGWMVGEWKASGDGWDATTKTFWTLDGRFLTRVFTINRGGEEAPFEGAEVIGYDHTRDEIRSWTFDSEGGFGDATRTQDANQWLVQAKATLPDGSESTAQHVFSLEDNDRFTMRSINRMVDGQALPNTDRIEAVRVQTTK
ncbi:unnamed protein product, partial [marine sediment metagenome]